MSYSFDPDPLNPQLSLNSYYGGDLGLDTGAPQNVYVLDVAKLTQLNGRDLPAGGITLQPGATYTLPEGKGSISFDGLKRYIGGGCTQYPPRPGLGAGIFAAGRGSSWSPCM